MNRIPKILVISASESESENSSSFDEECLEGDHSEVDKIAKTHQDLKRKLTYQLMQFRTSSRELLTDSGQSICKSPEFMTLPDSPDLQVKGKSFHDIAKIILDFQNTQKELEKAKSNILSMDLESKDLHVKLRSLEDRIKERRSRKDVHLSQCSCDIF
jgi:hypothetical protein